MFQGFWGKFIYEKMFSYILHSLYVLDIFEGHTAGADPFWDPSHLDAAWSCVEGGSKGCFHQGEQQGTQVQICQTNVQGSLSKRANTSNKEPKYKFARPMSHGRVISVYLFVSGSLYLSISIYPFLVYIYIYIPKII